MGMTIIKPSSAAGEIAPSLWGRVDLPKWHQGLSVARNGFVNYRGGFASRPGTLFCGQSLQPAFANENAPPHLIKFQFNIYQAYILEFGDDYMRVAANGGYVTEAPFHILGATPANPVSIDIPGNNFAVGDWVFISGVKGMTQINNRTLILLGKSGDNCTFATTFNKPVLGLHYGAYVSGGTAARIYTNRNSPYKAVDLPYLKVVQSADVMSLCCVNQLTGAEYPPVDLKRLAANNWNFETLTFASVIGPPGFISAVATVPGSAPYTQYAYVVTAVDAATGEESVASAVAYIAMSVDIAATAGSHIISWSPVAGAAQYNVYQAPPSYDTAVPVGSNFGFIGFSFGTQFVNTNIQADLATTPPIHQNPFAPGQILEVDITAQGTGYTQATVGYTLGSTGGGSGEVLIPIVVAGGVVAFIVQNPGGGFKPGTTITITDSGAGASATATVKIGPQSGTYPGVVNYFQQRRGYAATLNNPDTYFLSQTGAYLNFDSASPPIDSDSIVGTPWGEQVNGIQWLQPMPGGLLAATGLETWQLSGTTGAGSLVTPAQQSASPQESNGYSATVKPIKVNYDILYVGATTTAVYDLVYNFWNNIYAGTDISILSSHLFDGFTLHQWAWARQPFKLIWATRSDGKFLSLTFLKEQELIAWTRHDTNGIVVGNEVATEASVDAPYFMVKRYVRGEQQWAYFLERMDNRLWKGPEDPWCVDAGLALAQPTPRATLQAAAAEGAGNISGAYLATGGGGYSSPTALIVDPAGKGSGGVIALTMSGGAIVGFTLVAEGANYSPSTYCQILDPTGTGATLVLQISQNVLFTTDADVFTPQNVGDVIRVGGGIANITEWLSGHSVMASIVSPILVTMPNDPYRLPLPAGQTGINQGWSVTTPVSTLTNLGHLEGMHVAVLADGAVVAGADPGDPPLMTVVDGTITLPFPASAITIGLPFVVQMQTLHSEVPGAPTMQGKPQLVDSVAARVRGSRGFTLGANQPVASALDFQQELQWEGMRPVPNQGSVGLSANAIPLFTGDTPRMSVGGGPLNYNGFEPAPGMIAAQQLSPLPMEILALMPDLIVGDSNSQN